MLRPSHLQPSQGTASCNSMQLIAAHKSAPALGYSNPSASAHHSTLQLCTDTNGSPAACQQLPVLVVKLHENSCKDRAPEALHVPRINPKELTILLHCSTPPAPAQDEPCANPCSLGLAVVMYWVAPGPHCSQHSHWVTKRESRCQV